MDLMSTERFKDIVVSEVHVRNNKNIVCGITRSEYYKQYYEKNKDILVPKMLERYQRDKEKIKDDHQQNREEYNMKQRENRRIRKLKKQING